MDDTTATIDCTLTITERNDDQNIKLGFVVLVKGKMCHHKKNRRLAVDELGNALLVTLEIVNSIGMETLFHLHCLQFEKMALSS